MTVYKPGDFRTPGNYRGPIQQADPAGIQREAVIDQLAPPTAGAKATGAGARSPWAGTPGGGAPDPTVANAGLPDRGETETVTAHWLTPGGQPNTAAQRAGSAVANYMGAPTTGAASAFTRGGSVRQLPGMNTQGLAETGVGLGAQVGSQIARNAGQTAAKQGATQAATQAGGQAAKQGIGLTSFGGGAAGAATTAGIGLATGLLADKLRVREETPTFGGEFGDLTDEYGRRFEGTGGGVASNAVKYAGYGSAAGPIGMGIGAGVGALVGGLTKNAPSAYTDFRVEDAAEAIDKAYQKFLGRPASQDEIENQLKGQGWNPTGGDRWVGEKNLTGAGGVLDQIRNSPEAQAFAKGGAQRAATVDQLGTPAAASGADVPGSAPAPPGAGASPGAASDPSGWNTDGYDAPKYVPPGSGPVPNGWDQTKWNDPNHQTPKYGVGRILSNFPPTVDGLKAAMGDIEKAYPGTTFNGKDKITIPGVGTVDVLEAAGQGGKAWRWGAEDAGGGGGAAAPTATTGVGLTKADGGEARGNLLADLQAAIDRITRGEAPRAELMQQLGGANG